MIQNAKIDHLKYRRWSDAERVSGSFGSALSQMLPHLGDKDPF